MNENSKSTLHIRRESILGAASAGFFFVLIGAIFIATPKLSEEVINFFQGFKAATVPHTNVTLFAPEFPRNHLPVYSAAQQFALVWGFFLIAMLALRFVMHSPLRKKAENLSDIVFWFGTAYLIQTWLVETTRWFEFWALLIALIGFTLIVRAIVLATALIESS